MGMTFASATSDLDNSQIHVDRYKFSVFQHISDPYLKLITTQDPSATRFHACERFHRCDYVHVENGPNSYENVTSTLGKRVVYINPVTMDCEKWAKYLEVTERQLSEGQEVNNLVSPYVQMGDKVYSLTTRFPAARSLVPPLSPTRAAKICKTIPPTKGCPKYPRSSSAWTGLDLYRPHVCPLPPPIRSRRQNVTHIGQANRQVSTIDSERRRCSFEEPRGYRGPSRCGQVG